MKLPLPKIKINFAKVSKYYLSWLLVLATLVIITSFWRLTVLAKPQPLPEPDISLPQVNQQGLESVRNRLERSQPIDVESEVTGRDNPFSPYASYVPPAPKTEEETNSTQSTNNLDTSGGATGAAESDTAGSTSNTTLPLSNTTSTGTRDAGLSEPPEVPDYSPYTGQ